MCDNETRFRYILKSNHEVEISGTVHIPSDIGTDDSEFEIEFDRAGNTPSWNLFINHYGVDITGRTQEQDFEIEKLKELYCSDFLFLTRVCMFQDASGMMDLGEAYLVVNDFDFESAVRVN